MRPERRQFTPEEIAEIKAAYDADTNERVRRHLEVIYLYAQRKPYKQIEEMTGFETTTVYRLAQEYRKDGLRSMVERRHSSKHQSVACGNHFTPEQTVQLKNVRKIATNPKTIRRFDALLQLADGKTANEVGTATGYTPNIVYWLKQQFLKGGTASIFRMEHRKKRAFSAYKHKFSICHIHIPTTDKSQG